MMSKIDCWGVDIFRLNDVTRGRPLTAVAYTILQVIFNIALILALYKNMDQVKRIIVGLNNQTIECYSIFLPFYIRNWSDIATHLVLLVVVVLVGLRLRRFKLDCDAIRQDCYSIECASIDGVRFSICRHILRWRPWRHFTQKSAATWPVNTKRPPVPDLACGCRPSVRAHFTGACCRRNAMEYRCVPLPSLPKVPEGFLFEIFSCKVQIHLFNQNHAKFLMTLNGKI